VFGSITFRTLRSKISFAEKSEPNAAQVALLGRHVPQIPPSLDEVAVGAFDWAIDTLDHRHGFLLPKALRSLCCVEARDGRIILKGKSSLLDRR